MASHTCRLAQPSGRVPRGWLILPLLGLMMPLGLRAEDPRWDPASIQHVDELMLQDPTFVLPKAKVVVSDEPKSLWLRALARPDAQLQRVTIDTIALAHERGMEGLEEAIPTLAQMLREPDLHVEVRCAAINALVVMKAKQHASLLADLSRTAGARVAAVAEPALIQWQSPVMVETWLARLDDPAARPTALTYAIDGLAAVGATQAAPSLTNLVNDVRKPARVRIAAARALGTLQTSGLEETAARLADSGGNLTAEIMAIELLAGHRDEKSLSILTSLAKAENTAVQATALSRLYAFDPSLVDALALDAMHSKDVNVRRLAARAMVVSEKAERIEPLTRLLDDVNPGLRREVAAALVHLANKAGLKDEVLQYTGDVLKRDAWRGCEQAAIVLVNLEQKSIADRLIELLDHQRGEVMIVSAWGLRKFAMQENLPAMLEHAKKVYRDFKSGQASASDLGPQQKQAQLFMSFGDLRYREAEELIRAYLPKDLSLGDRSRAAATWAIGHLQEGQAPQDLTDLLVQRMNDYLNMPPEEPIVRYTCMISLGRMKSKSAVEDIREFARVNDGEMGMAAFWAIEQLSGEPIPEFPEPIVTFDDWFLEPLSSAQPENE